MKFGILLPTRGVLLQESFPINPNELLRMAETAEGAGYSSLWVGDSLLSKPRLEPLSVLAAIAARTERIGLGTAVLLAALRHPISLAQTVATLDILSQGRLTLAVGVGGTFTTELKQEWEALEIDPVKRAGRLEESVMILRQAWLANPIMFHGNHFQLRNVTINPKPIQANGIPILFACHHRTGSSAQLERAARLGDGFISISDTPQEYQELRSAFHNHAQRIGRNVEMLASAFYLTININTNVTLAETEANQFLTSYYGFNHWGKRWGPFGCPDQIIRRIQEYGAAGVDHMIVRFASWNQTEQLAAFTREVLPAFQS